jgi:hypothetical protein
MKLLILALYLGACVASSGCGDSSASTELPKIDEAQAKAAEEATAKAVKNQPKPQAKKY